jgi:hypothetical protein
MLVAPPHEMLQSEGDFIGMYRTPGDDALQFDASSVIALISMSSVSMMSASRISIFSMAHAAKAVVKERVPIMAGNKLFYFFGGESASAAGRSWDWIELTKPWQCDPGFTTKGGSSAAFESISVDRASGVCLEFGFTGGLCSRPCRAIDPHYTRACKHRYWDTAFPYPERSRGLGSACPRPPGTCPCTTWHRES